MLKIGIIDNNNANSYISAIKLLENIELIGIFDPSFQFDYPKNRNPNLIYSSFEELLNKTDSIIFTSTENIYIPLIEMSIKYSKAVFLHSIHNFSQHEQIQLQKLKDEAGSILQIQNSIIFNDIFTKFTNLSTKPLLLHYDYSNPLTTNLLQDTRLIISSVLSLYKSNLRKITVNTISTFSELTDVIKIRLDFDNGCIAEIISNSIGKIHQNSIKSYEYNSCLDINLIDYTIKGENAEKNISFKSDAEKNTQTKILCRQLTDFYNNTTNYSLPTNSVENEIITQQIIEKVKEKLRISINVY